MDRTSRQNRTRDDSTRGSRQRCSLVPPWVSWSESCFGRSCGSRDPPLGRIGHIPVTYIVYPMTHRAVRHAAVQQAGCWSKIVIANNIGTHSLTGGSMKLTRRSAMGLLAAGSSALLRRPAAAQQPAIEIESGPFQATRESLRQYQIPEWFRDAKFGIWAHWGPQSAAEDGDWYARNMYIEGGKQYQVSPRELRASLEVRLQGRHRHLESRALRPRAPDGPLQESGGEILRQHGGAPRQLRPVELEVSTALERGGVGAEEGRCRRCSGRRPGNAGCGSASASICPTATTGSDLHRSRQARAASRRALRRHRSQVRRPLPRHSRPTRSGPRRR